MHLEEFQIGVKDYFEKGKFPPWPRFVVLARLEEEISEIGRILSVMEGYREKWKIDNMDIEDEFGDALFQLAHLSNLCGVDLESASKRVFEKYPHYLPKK